MIKNAKSQVKIVRSHLNFRVTASEMCFDADQDVG